MLAASDQETLAELRQNVLRSQLSIAAHLDCEMRNFWERAASTRDEGSARHLAQQAALVTEQLRQALCVLAEERDISGEVVVAVVRAIQKHNAVTAEAVADLGKVLVHMAEEADALELQQDAERASALLDKVFSAAAEDASEEDSHEQ
jgi:hypothetical protein